MAINDASVTQRIGALYALASFEREASKKAKTVEADLGGHGEGCEGRRAKPSKREGVEGAKPSKGRRCRRSRCPGWCVRMIWVEHSFRPFHEDANVEIHDQADLDVGQTEIRRHLREVDRQDRGNRFDLDQQLVFNNEVDDVRPGYDLALVLDRQRPLEIDFESALLERPEHRQVVGVLEQSRAELAVDLDSDANHVLRQATRSIVNQHAG